MRKVAGYILLVIAAIPVASYLLIDQFHPIPLEHQLAEEKWLAQFWAVVAPTAAIFGLSLVFWERLVKLFSNAK
ncbi:MAG: hypothetical protein ACJ8C4_08265 [Gemmataceae bacterium]